MLMGINHAYFCHKTLEELCELHHPAVCFAKVSYNK